jgi:hypothetical protein
LTNLVPLLSSNDETWNTPAWFIARVRRALGVIGLDPCSNAHAFAAMRSYRLDAGEDGLALPWAGHGLVFLNPPYGRVIGRWMARCHEADELVALVPSRTDTVWWQDSAAACAALVLWRRRFKFTLRGGEVNSAPFPSSIFYYGARAGLFLGEFARDGFVAKQPASTAALIREAA